MRILQMFLLLVSVNAVAQNIDGKWYGLLQVPGQKLRIELDIEKTSLGYKSIMYSLDQTEQGIPVGKTKFVDSVLRIKIAMGFIQYTGKFTDSIFVGEFKQFGQKFPLTLTRTYIEKQLVHRQQEPMLPYPYTTEDVSFFNSKDSVKLAGTLSKPLGNDKYPVVILISGSGPQNRDEEIANHKPFLVLADYLTRNGIAVLRYDDRGFAKSTGCHACATTMDFASDVESAMKFLKSRNDVDTSKIGLIGHSEGGMIAPIVASKVRDVSFMVLLAAPGISLEDIIKDQNEQYLRAVNESENKIAITNEITAQTINIVKNAKTEKQAKTELTTYMKKATKRNKILIPEGANRKEFIRMYVLEYATIWMMYALNYDPSPALEKIKCPVFALNGDKDLQVSKDKNLELIKTIINRGGNQQVTLKSYQNLNHLFQECKTGSPAEYAIIEQTFSPIVMNDIVSWIKSVIK